MRIALCTETFLPKIDGIVTRLTHTVRHLCDAGDEVLVVAPERGVTEHAGARVLGVRGFPMPLYPELHLAPSGRRTGRAIDEFEPDLVHVVNPAVLGVTTMLHARRRRLPLLASYHTHVPKYLRYYRLGALEGLCWMLLRSAHNRAAFNLCTSTAMIDELTAKGIRGCALWQRGVDTELFHPDRASRQMRHRLTDGNPDAPLLIYVGRLSAEKRIERIRHVLEATPDARLALIGDGPHRARLEAHFAGTPTHFAGYLTGQTLASAFASADLFLFPSPTETLGLVLLEAMAAGCPVVAANAGGIPDIVTDGVNGTLFDPEDDQGLIQATRRLLDRDEQRAGIREAARAEAERWGWAASTEQLRGHYRRVLETHRGNVSVRGRRRRRHERVPADAQPSHRPDGSALPGRKGAA